MQVVAPISIAPSPTTPMMVGESAKAATSGGIEVQWAQHLDEVREAQKLRYDIFAGEMGARLRTTIPGHDVDLFDVVLAQNVGRRRSTSAAHIDPLLRV